MQVLTLFEDIFDALALGKLTTIRKGRLIIEPGSLLFESVESKRQEVVRVVHVQYCKLADVPLLDLQNDGFKDHLDMAEKMKRFYPAITLEDEITLVKFERLVSCY